MEGAAFDPEALAAGIDAGLAVLAHRRRRHRARGGAGDRVKGLLPAKPARG